MQEKFGCSRNICTPLPRSLCPKLHSPFPRQPSATATLCCEERAAGRRAGMPGVPAHRPAPAFPRRRPPPGHERGPAGRSGAHLGPRPAEAGGAGAEGARRERVPPRPSLPAPIPSLCARRRRRRAPSSRARAAPAGKSPAERSGASRHPRPGRGAASLCPGTPRPWRLFFFFFFPPLFECFLKNF